MDSGPLSVLFYRSFMRSRDPSHPSRHDGTPFTSTHVGRSEPHSTGRPCRVTPDSSTVPSNTYVTLLDQLLWRQTEVSDVGKPFLAVSTTTPSFPFTTDLTGDSPTEVFVYVHWEDPLRHHVPVTHSSREQTLRTLGIQRDLMRYD